MKIFWLAVSLVVLPSWAFGQTTPNAGQLVYYINQQLAGIANPCPSITGAVMGDPADSSTWTVSYASAPSGACTAAVAGFIASFTTPPAAPSTLQITSTGTPSIDAIYAVDSLAQANITGMTVYLSVNGAFPTGSTISWADTSGIGHAFDATNWNNFATVVANHVLACTSPVPTPLACVGFATIP